MLVLPFLSDPIVFVLSIAQPTPFGKRKMAAVLYCRFDWRVLEYSKIIFYNKIIIMIR